MACVVGLGTLSTDMDSRNLTWAALLGRWVELAQAAVALPDDAEGRAWRSAVPHVITLQAVTMALGEVDDLPADERALGIDRARILVERARAGLDEWFEADDVHPMVAELLGDAEAAVAKAEAMMSDSDGGAAGAGETDD